MERGPKTQAVWDTLPNRAAGIINGASQRAQDCFAGFFNGAFRSGTVFNGNLSFGKAECEWDWRETWTELCRLGLITWTETFEANDRTVGGVWQRAHLTITDKGHEVREDDLKWFREVMNAQRADEAAA